MSRTHKRILFVDDDANVLDGIRRALHDPQSGWEMAFVCNVDEAISELSRHGFDAVVTDVAMPGGDGFTLLRLIRESKAHRDIPVIMMTGRTDSELKAIAICLGAYDFLPKPVAEEDLLARLRAALRFKAVHDEFKQANAALGAGQRMAEDPENG